MKIFELALSESNYWVYAERNGEKKLLRALCANFVWQLIEGKPEKIRVTVDTQPIEGAKKLKVWPNFYGWCWSNPEMNFTMQTDTAPVYTYASEVLNNIFGQHVGKHSDNSFDIWLLIEPS